MIRRGGVTDVPLFLAVGNKVFISIQHFTGCNYGFSHITAWVLASHKTNFESVAQGTWESDIAIFE